MDTTPPSKSAGREIAERIGEAAVGSIPLAGAALAVALVTTLDWRLNRQRDEWFARLAEDLAEMRERFDGFDPENLVADDRFADAVMKAIRSVEHSSQEEKLDALRNAVLNSVGPDAPDADTQAIFLDLLDRWTPSHLRLLNLWDDPPAWFESHGLTPPQNVMAGGRRLTVEAGLPEMQGRGDFYRLLASDLGSAGMMTADLSGMVTGPSLMSRLTTDLGRQFVRFVSPPAGQRLRS